MTRVGKIAIVVTFGAMCVFEQGLWSARPAAGAAAAVDWSAVPAKASVASAVAAAVDVTPAKAVVAAAPVMPPPVTPSFKQPAVFYTDRCGSFGIAVGDLDGEDGLDLVVCSKDRPQSWNPACTATTRTGITVFLNSGDWSGDPPTGGFLTPTSNDQYSITGGVPVDVALVDIDNDVNHRLDMVVSVWSDELLQEIAIFKAHPTVPGRFETTPTYYSAWSQGGGVTWDTGAYDSTPVSEFLHFAVLDYDSSGTLDVVMPATRWSTDIKPALLILKGQSNWSQSPIIATKLLPESGDLTVGYGQDVATGTFDSGSSIDFAVNIESDPGASAEPVYVAPNNSGTLGTAVNNSSIPSKGIVTALLNSGSVLDLAVTHWSAGGTDAHRVRVLTGNGDLTFSLAGEYTVDRDPYGIAAGQIAGDVKVDLVTANMHGDSGGTTDNFHGNITVLVNKGLTGNPAQLTFDRTDFKVMSSGSRPKPAQVLLADLNGDGQKDVITANWNAASVSVLINTYVQTLP